VGQVIKGWDEGLQGMCLNEKRTLTIPSEMAYGWFIPAIHEIYAHSWFLGSRGFGSVIPANSALVFDVELVSLQKASREEL
jgi:FK506-binding protein 2